MKLPNVFRNGFNFISPDIQILQTGQIQNVFGKLCEQIATQIQLSECAIFGLHIFGQRIIIEQIVFGNERRQWTLHQQLLRQTAQTVRTEIQNA